MATLTQDKKTVFLEGLIPNQPVSQKEKNIISDAERHLARLDFPSSKNEYWKYTGTRRIINQKYSQTPDFKANISSLPVLDDCPNTLVFINGYFSEEQSEIADEAFILPLSKAKSQNTKEFLDFFARINDYKNHIFSAINTVYHTNGVFINLPEDKQLQKTQIIFLNTTRQPLFNPRNLFILHTGSSADISFLNISDGESGGFCNAVTEIYLKDNSRLNLQNIQNPSASTHIIHTIDVNQEAYTHFKSFTATFNGDIVRNNLNVHQLASGCETDLYGFALLSGKTHADNHTLIEHLHPHNNSNEWYKYVMDRKAVGVFNGKVLVAKDAQQTNAFQQNNNILLSDDAKIYSKPELEIYADDVKCSHGSTTGQIDEDALFYLRARGIGYAKAMDLLIDAFIEDVIKELENESVINYLRNIKEHVGFITR